MPQVAVEFILTSLRRFGLSRPNLVGQVITLKLYGRIAFVTEGQTPVTNGLEVGIAVVVTFFYGLWVFGLGIFEL
jgi:hypothetical protein